MKRGFIEAGKALENEDIWKEIYDAQGFNGILYECVKIISDRYLLPYEETMRISKAMAVMIHANII